MTNIHNPAPPAEEAQKEVILDNCMNAASAIVSQAPHIFISISENYTQTIQKGKNLHDKIKRGVRKTDGNGSFLL